MKNTPNSRSRTSKSDHIDNTLSSTSCCNAPTARFATHGKWLNMGVRGGRYLIHLVQAKELLALHVIRAPRPLHLVGQLASLLQVVQRTSKPCTTRLSLRVWPTKKCTGYTLHMSWDLRQIDSSQFIGGNDQSHQAWPNKPFWSWQHAREACQQVCMGSYTSPSKGNAYPDFQQKN